MIAFNGAVLYDCAADRVLLKRSLPIEIVQELFDKAKRAGLYVQTYNSTDLITTKHTKELDYYVKQARISYKISPNILDALEEEPQKVMLISLDQRDKLERFQKKNLNWEKGKCNSFFSSSQYLEYSPKNTSKATGILELTKILNMPMDATVAVGDEDNDVPMIKTACIGVAVKNATEKAKAAADYVTVNDNNHDAIARGDREIYFIGQTFFAIREMVLLPGARFDIGQDRIWNIKMPTSGSKLYCGFVFTMEIRTAADEQFVFFCNAFDKLFFPGGIGRVDCLDAIKSHSF